jgi:hypothetical protein
VIIDFFFICRAFITVRVPGYLWSGKLLMYGNLVEGSRKLYGGDLELAVSVKLFNVR